MPINCPICRDGLRFRSKSLVDRNLIDDYFLGKRDKIVETDDYFGDENIITKSDRVSIK